MNSNRRMLHTQFRFNLSQSKTTMQIFIWHFYLIILWQIIDEASACPDLCTCKWKNGKQTAECANKTLFEIPDGMDPGTQVLEFSGNSLGKLSKELFAKKQLINLQRLYLSKCGIKSVHKETFKGLTNLVELDLSHNLIESIPTNAFMNCPSLMKLTLSGNPINSIKKLAFNHLSYLNALELKGCEIAEVEEGAFQGLHSLEWLYLGDNHLNYIKGPGTLPLNLKGLELQRNPWICDCNLRDLYQWLSKFHVPFSLDPVCDAPEKLKGTKISDVSLDKLACLPDVSPTVFFLELGEGKNVSLLCQVYAVPAATISWWFDGQLLQNNTRIAPGISVIYIIEEGAEKKRSELFIYNASAEDNGTFVCNAENDAGAAQSNFTIRIILKEEPVVAFVSFPFEYFIVLVAAVGSISFIMIVVLTLCIVKCHRNKKKKAGNRNQIKEVAFQIEQDQCVNNGGKASVEKSASPPLSTQSVYSPAPTPAYLESTEEIILNKIQNSRRDELYNVSVVSPIRAGSRNAQQQNPTVSANAVPMTRYQMEQNPDLLNGTDKRLADGEESCWVLKDRADKGVAEFYANIEKATAMNLRRMNAQDSCDFDVPKGVPAGPCNRPFYNDQTYYRTLPCNRMKRNASANAAISMKRYSREVEFLSRSVDAAYDHYHADIRYTADGLPPPPIRHMPGAVFATTNDQMPQPPPHQVIPSGVAVLPWQPSRIPNMMPVTKKSASAQTDTEDDDSVVGCSISKKPPVKKSVKIDIDTQSQEEPAGREDNSNNSPDEGYEGEPSLVV